MTTGAAKGSGRRGEVLEAALEIADARGLSAVTMRAVAARIGVTAMALYPHVRSKNDLLDGLVGRLLAEFAIPDQELPWQDRLRAIAYSMRDVACRHPSVVPLLFSRPAITPEGIGVVDALYRALLDAGVPPREVPRIERMFSTFIIGYAASETGGRFAVGTPADRKQWRARLSSPDFEFPAHHKLARYLLAPWSHQEEFEADLDDLMALIRSVSV
jgi:AcrR family transcriptional regulator